MFNFPVSFLNPLLNWESESILKVELNLVVCSIIPIDLDDEPLIDSPDLNVSLDNTFKYLLSSFQPTTVPTLSPVLTVSPTLKLFGSTLMSNWARFSKGIAWPDDEGPLKMPGLVTEESKLYDTVAFPPPGFVFTPVITKDS